MGRVKWIVGFAVMIGMAVSTVYAKEEACSGTAASPGSSQIVAGGAVGQVVSMTAEVVAVDAAKREVTLKLADGKKKKVVVGSGAHNFDQIAVGDVVNIDVQESVAVFVDRMPSEPDASAEGILARAPKGQKPEGVMVATEDATATVTDIDYQKRAISLLGPDGNTMTVIVPEGAAPNFDKIQKGDTVVARYTVALALKVEAAAPANQ